MAENYFVTERRRSKQELLNFLTQNKDMPLDKALGRFSARTGFKVTTLKTWVEEFVMAEMIKISNNAIE